MGTSLNGSLVLQGNIPLRTSQFKHLKLLARERLGTRWAKYPFSRCRQMPRIIKRRASASEMARGSLPNLGFPPKHFLKLLARQATGYPSVSRCRPRSVYHSLGLKTDDCSSRASHRAERRGAETSHKTRRRGSFPGGRCLQTCSGTWKTPFAIPPLCPVSLLRISKLRLLDSNVPENSLWAWEFHPFTSRFCLSQTL